MNALMLELDKNPYNDKETEDMLRHFKLEYFLMTNPMAFIITEALLLSQRFYHLECRGEISHNMKVCLICCIVPRALKYLYYSLSLKFGNEWFEDHMWFINWVVGLMSYGVAIFVWIELYSIDTNTNLVLHGWLKLETTALLIEPTLLIVLSRCKPKEEDFEDED